MLNIDGTRIADDTECYVIAELGHNHQGDLEICKEMIRQAKWAGCNAVKLQKRDNKSLYAEEFYNSPYNSENAFGPTYGAHREALEFSLIEYAELLAFAERESITLFATAFDLESLRFLIDLDVPAIKIASGDLTNKTLLKAAAASGRPVIVSTGGATEEDILALPRLLEGSEGAILHCTSGYPAKYEELNLRCIPWLRAEFMGTVIGWSGHDTGIAMAMCAYALGARIIEKHFTLNRAWKGTDQSFSLEPQGMKAMVDNLKLAHLAMGDGHKKIYDSERVALAKQWKNANGQIDGRVSQAG